MSGHSHWATIKRKKEANDHERGKLFSKVTREIMLAIQEGGGITDPGANIRLRSAMEKAKEVNMPKDNIQRIIDRVKERRENISEVVYEAIGPSGISYVIKTASDNPRRTQTEIKILMDKNGGKLVEKGAVMYNFVLCGMFMLENKTEEEALMAAEALGAIDMENEEGTYFIYVNYDDLSAAWQKAQETGINKAPELVYKPRTYIDVDAETSQKALRLMETLEDLEDVQSTFTNMSLKE